MSLSPARGGQFVPPQVEALSLAVEYAYATGVLGDVVEFGCYLGTTTEWLAHAMHEMTAKYGYADRLHGVAERRLWALDSFEGFPEATDPVDAASPQVKAGLWYAGAPTGGSPQIVHGKCAAFLGSDRVTVIPGWYKDTLAQIPPSTRFAVVHVDCDYHESASQVLHHLFANDMLSDGATILFDDWYCNRGSPCFGEQRAWNEAVAHWRPAFSDWGPYGVVGRRFIVHGVNTAGQGGD